MPYPRFPALLCVVAAVHAAPADDADIGRYLRPANYSARVGDVLRLSVCEGGLSNRAAADWPTGKIDRLFVRVAGFQDNLHAIGIQPPRPDAAFVEVPLRHAGVTLLGLDTSPQVYLVPAARFQALLSGAGVVAAPPRAAAPGGGAGLRAAGAGVRVVHVDSSKALVRVSMDQADETHSAVAQSKTGQAAEIRLMADPWHTPVGSDIPLRVYLRGSPAADVPLVATCAAGGEPLRLTTNDSGLTYLTVTSPGLWMLECWLAEPATGRADADWLTWRATLTFEAAAGGQP